MTTLNSWFEKETYTKAAGKAAGGCAKAFLILVLFAVLVPGIALVVTLFAPKSDGKAVCPHCGKPLLILKGE